MGALKVGKGVADHPYGLIGGNSRAVERQIDRVRRWFVALGVLGADRTGDPALPAEMGHLDSQVFTHLVADDSDITPRLPAAGQQQVGAWQGFQALQVNAVEGLVEDPLRFAGARTEQFGEKVAK